MNEHTPAATAANPPAPATASAVRLALLSALEALPIEHRRGLRDALHLFDRYAAQQEPQR